MSAILFSLLSLSLSLSQAQKGEDEELYTYPRQLRNHHPQNGQKVNHEINEVVMRIMRAEQKQQYGHYQQELLRRRVLVAVVDLLPHVEVVVGAGVELEGHALHPVEHEV